MSNEVLVAIIAFFGTLVGTAGGIIASSKLTNYRIKKLEEKVDKHNMIIERTYVLEEKMKAANHRIGDLETKVMM
jgi:ABC-type lipoprotein release transport system permease subunit